LNTSVPKTRIQLKKTGLFPNENFSGLANTAFFRLFLEAKEKMIGSIQNRRPF